MSASTVRTGRVHDADLCDHIKRLERRVDELERELRAHGPHSYPYITWPYQTWPHQPYRPYPVWYSNTMGTGDNISTTQTLLISNG